LRDPKTIVFVLLGLFCLRGYVSPPLALALGLALALSIGNPLLKPTQKVSKFLLQASVVGLGFGMNLGTLLTIKHPEHEFVMP
jgi:uncharacterized membrane protein YadS